MDAAERKARRWVIAVGSLIAIATVAAWASVIVRAKVQADVWRRQGVEISTLEVLLGAQPAVLPNVSPHR